MFGGPGAQPTKEQRQLQEKYSMDTLKMAGLMAATLWATPIVYHWVTRQF